MPKHPDKRAEKAYEQGLAAARAGDMAGAARHYARALKVDPGHVGALHDLAMVAYRQGDFGRAADLADRLPADVRGQPAVAWMEGVANLKAARIGVAGQLFEALARNAPTRPEGAFGLGLVATKMRRYDQARGFFERALGLAPGHRGALMNLIELLERMGRTEDCRARIAEARALTPDDPDLDAFEAMLLIQERRFDDALALLGRVTAGDPARRWFLTAQALQGLGRAEEAFDAYAKANAADATAWADRPVGKDRVFAEIAAAKAYDGPLDPLGEAGEGIVFVVGMPRTGTTLMQSLLEGVPGLCGLDEAPFLDSLAAKAARLTGKPYPRAVGALDAAQAAALAADYRAMVAIPHGDADCRVIVDKHPLNLLHLPLVARVFPKARVVTMVRHPYAVALSGFMQRFAAPAMQNFQTLDGGLALYVAVMDLWADLKRRLPLAWTEVRFENLAAEPGPEVARLLDFLGLDVDVSMLLDATGREGRTYSTPSTHAVREAVNARPTARWHAYAAHFPPPTEPLRAIAEAHGYDLEE